MKKIILIALVLVLALSTVVYAEEVITVTVNGEAVVFDVQPMTVNDRTMVPLRAIFEKLGAEVSYDDATRTVTAKKDNTVVKLTIDSTSMFVNETEKILDVPAFETEGRTLVPVRAISEAFGCTVNWHEEEKLVEIVEGDKVIGYVSDSNGKIDIYQYEMDYLVNTGYSPDESYDILKETKVMQLKAIENGVVMDESDLAKIQSGIDAYIQQFGSKENFVLQLNVLGITYEQYIEICKMSDHASKFQNQMTDLGLIKESTEEEIRKYFDDNFMKAKHILISDKTKAYEVSHNINKGKKFEDYRDLCEDPGSKSNPDGYVFAKATKFSDDSLEKQYFAYSGLMMVEEFEKGTAALKVGEISQPIQTSYGYHIINRVALTDEDYVIYKELIKIILDNTTYTDVVTKWINEAELIKL